jgi:transcriptional regulator with XRE-family HTH domain
VEGSRPEGPGFGDWFAMRRKRKGTLTQVARELGLPKQVVKAWERGVPPDFALARQIATVLGVSEDEVAMEIARAHAERRASEPGAERGGHRRTTRMMDPGGRRWHVTGGGGEVELPSSLDSAVAWGWTLSGDEGEAVVVVWVNRAAWASREGDLPWSVVEAIEVRGLWAVERYLHRREPPRRIEVTTQGFSPTGGSEE